MPSSGGMVPATRPWVRWFVIASLVLALASTTYWLVQTDVGDWRRLLEGLRWWQPPALLLLSLGAMGLRFLRWHYLLRVMGVLVPVRSSLTVYLAGYAMILTPAYLGEVIKAPLLAGRHRTPLAPLVALVATERLYDVLALALIAVIAGWGAGVPLGVAVAALVGAALVGSILVGAARRREERRRTDPSSADLTALARPRALLLGSVLSLLSWSLAAATLGVALEGILAPAPLRSGMALFAESSLIGGLSLVPAGGGVTGSSMIVGLGRLGLAVDAAAPPVVLVRLVTVWLAVAIGLVALARQTRRLVSPDRFLELSHFDQLAPDYGDQIAPHMRDHFLAKKVGVMLRQLGRDTSRIGLDIGCGQGWYARTLMDRSPHRVVGVDRSFGQVREARGQGLHLAVADGTRLPFRSGTFDFAYSINVFHHIEEEGGQEAAFAEVERVLAPGGLFFLHEMNVTNLVFRIYLGYVFPLIREIDEGTERWLLPAELARSGQLDLEHIDYFSFLPDFLPAPLLRWLAPIERRLERSRFRHLSAHYVARFRRRPEPGPPPAEA